MRTLARPLLPIIIIIIAAAHVPTLLLAYGPLGHEIVGAIADERLANTPAAAKVDALLEGLPLEKASLLADEIKSWDKNGPDDPRSFHVSGHRNLDRQLRDFWRANPPAQDQIARAPSHHWFHYTDVPVLPPQRYRDGRAGRGRWDIVHMIPYCVQVLQGRITEQNERRITKPVALILLSHLVGDIHQPLHVGAEYFAPGGRVVNPDKAAPALGDQGGNSFFLELSDEPPRKRGIHRKKLHGFWDYNAVNALFPELPAQLRKRELEILVEPLKKKLVHQLATEEPQNWQIPESIAISSYAEAWADEILPRAREAYGRLSLKNVHPALVEGHLVAVGEAIEIPQPGQLTYRQWAAGVVREELHKAGWRLADLLQKIL